MCKLGYIQPIGVPNTSPGWLLASRRADIFKSSELNTLDGSRARGYSELRTLHLYWAFWWGKSWIGISIRAIPTPLYRSTGKRAAWVFNQLED
ncbi:hypothetical protein PHLCEN_2v5589 [Hermanssonia centrifuga]|uniref:Uncharacterized protein n=1 Tax=Hermanssonia centrifuga TaxID=98765 RepID=A0A2R6P214_9APHY|nr:hypothetical protein PHLCEN_2v5589 [Hermanssonia centrifuga]